MARYPTDGNEVDKADAGTAALLAEVEALKHRLAALAARLPESTPGEPRSAGQSKRRPSTKTVVHLTAGAMLAMLAGGAMAYGADALIIGPDGATIFAKSINFGSRLGALLTLYDPEFVIGIQPETFYQRSYKNFAWYKGGGHTNTELDPGGGSKMMSLTDGNLDVAGSVKAKSFDVDGAGGVTAGTVKAGTVTTGTLTVSDQEKGLTVSGPIKIDGKAGLKELTIAGTKLVNQKETPVTWVQINGRNEFKDDENVGPLRVGAAYGIPGIYSEAGDVVVGSQSGNIQLRGKAIGEVVYQRDDEPQTTYQKPLWRYHMSLTGAKYGGKTKRIPDDVLATLCGKPDGCEVRLGMTRWQNGNETETASIVKRLYIGDGGRWRTNTPGEEQGVIAKGNTKHVMNAWDTCLLTTGTYENYQDKGDQQTGLQLLVWKGPKDIYNNPARTCELTIIP